MPEISVVIPVFGCAECLTTLVARIVAAVTPITPSFEIVFVDDRSPDGAWDVLQGLAGTDPRVRAIRLSRNFGQHAAITAGLTTAAGERIVVMDCDLQEPPEIIPRLYAKAQEGYDVVRTQRRGRRHAPLRRWASRAYRWLFLERNRDADYSTLSMISRKVADAFLTLGDRDREYLLVLDWLGFSEATVDFDHDDRLAGETSYTLGRLVRVAFDGLFFRTTVLLRLIVLAGFAIAACGVGLAIYETIVYFLVGSPAGYTTLIVVLLILSGFILTSLGVVGLYVGRIFEQVKGRPLFVVDERLGRVDHTETAAAPRLVAPDDG